MKITFVFLLGFVLGIVYLAYVIVDQGITSNDLKQLARQKKLAAGRHRRSAARGAVILD